MEKVRALRERARECQAMAAKAPNAEVRGHYENLARMWEKLAQERVAFFVEQPKISSAEVGDE